MPSEPGGGAVAHYVQQCDGPIFTGTGQGVLDCTCGNRLVDLYEPGNFLDITLQCGRCGALTTTPPLADPSRPPSALVVAEPVAEPRTAVAAVIQGGALISKAEMDRLGALFRPRTPPDWAYQVNEALLERVEANYRRATGQSLPECAAAPADPFAGLQDHALAWAVGHLRACMSAAGGWRADAGIPTPIAVAAVTSFLHFVDTWSQHPLFPAMIAGAAARRFSPHGLAPFAAAHCAVMMGNRINFPAPEGDPPALSSFNIAIGPSEVISVQLELFDRFEVPFGQNWNAATLRAAVADRIAASAARINPRHHGMLLFSPGSALAGFDEAMIEALRDVLQTQGRRHRGLMAVAPMVLRLQQMPDPHTVRLCYGFFAIANRHFEGDTVLQTAS